MTLIIQGDPEPIGLIYELARLYSITNGSGVTWDGNKKSISLPDGLYTKVNNETENDDDQWQERFLTLFMTPFDPLEVMNICEHL